MHAEHVDGAVAQAYGLRWSIGVSRVNHLAYLR
jgi:hypothetical protein